MALATADADGRPSVRMVLLKGHDARGFVFYTNSREPQGRASSPPIRARPCSSTGSRCAARSASKGRSSRSSDAEADAYFATRSRDRQLGAWASDQSRPLESRAAVRGALSQSCRERFEGGEVPRPPHWWGYRARPRADRILDRPRRTGCTSAACSSRDGDGWSEGLLYP